MRRSVTVSPILVAIFLAAQPGVADDGRIDFFEKQVRPLLVRSCLKCHGAKMQKGGLRLDDRTAILRGGERGPAIRLGKPDESLLIAAIGYEGKLRMPPDGKLNDRETAVLFDWVRMGAPWPDVGGDAINGDGRTLAEGGQFWSFQPVVDPPLPAVKKAAWCRTPIDRFILARLEQRGLAPTRPASRHTLMRRVTFDLTGLPPTPEEIDDFLSDRSDEAFARVVDRLLSSPAHGERWARHWLDVVRYADARDLIQLPAASDFREAWRYRDWVVRALNDDMPYQDFIRYQIAGDLMQPADPEKIHKDALVATGMLAIADFVPGDVDKDLMVADYVDDMINVVGQSMLGMTLACARCHDHKFDPISTEDYYALAGIFFSTRLVDDIPNNPGNTPLVRVDLLTGEERRKIDARLAADRKQLVEIEREISTLYESLAGFEIVSITWGPGGTTFHRNGAQVGSNRDIDSVSSDPNIPALIIGASGTLNSPKFRGLVAELRVYDQPLDEASRSAVEAELFGRWFRGADPDLDLDADDRPFAMAEILRFRADDPEIAVGEDGRVTRWPDRAGDREDAVPSGKTPGPRRIQTTFNGQTRPALRFTGEELLEAQRSVPTVGSASIVFKKAGPPNGSERLIGWEDSQAGSHGVGIQPEANGALRIIVRKDGASGDIFSATPVPLPDEFLSATDAVDKSETTARLKALEQLRKKEQEALAKKPGPEIPRAVVVQEGGPTGTRHEGFQDAHVFIRGDHRQLGAKVARGFPRIFAGQNPTPIPVGSGRLQLASWIASEGHPLTARVLVNRLWHHHFGSGLVRTTTNFGRRGDRPSHPELLDYLAARFVTSGWSMKAMHRMIVLSSAYQQGSRAGPEGLRLDPENRLLWRMNRRRLTAEGIRDNLLSVAGNLDTRQGGPSFQELATPRRTLYLMATRTGAKTADFGPLFDRADCGAIVGERTTSTVAPQALFLMNDPFVPEQASALARRVGTGGPAVVEAVVEARIQTLYELALGRPATAEEVEIGLKTLGSFAEVSGSMAAWERYCAIVLCMNEFIYVD